MNEHRLGSALNLSNIALVEEMYHRYLVDPESVDVSWRYFFEGVDFFGVKSPSLDDSKCRILNLIQAYRRYGHLKAQINPIETSPKIVPELELHSLGFSSEELLKLFPTLGFCGKKEASLQEIIDALSQIYCSRVGFETMDLGVPGLEEWFQKRLEPKLALEFTSDEKLSILDSLHASEVFETFLHTKYPGQTRFSLEGNDTLIPMLLGLIAKGAENGMDGFVIGMPHRGRLNVLTNVLGKPHHVLFKEFEDVIPYLEGESGDVKYHKGFSSDVQFGDRLIHLHLAANSSALESVDAIVLGMTKAKQVQEKRFGAILIHGDAALSGQGVVYETLQMGRVDGFSTGGTIHIAVNNQIGYTTLPQEGRSTRYCTDIAKTFSLPVFHVNAEDPESCLFAARLGLEFRLAFGRDVFIDLNGYRKYGHNEGDEPSFTQPIEYKLIRSKKSIPELYLEKLTQEGVEIQKNGETEIKQKIAEDFEIKKGTEVLDLKHRFGSSWNDFVQPPSEMLFAHFDTKVDKALLQEVMNIYTSVPSSFHMHPKLAKWVQDRKLQLSKDPASSSIDWGTAEALSFGSILAQGGPVRLVGQDAKRGTFSQRHAVWFDQETGSSYTPFSQFKTRFDVYNTILSEYGSLGFEFGYSWASLDTLVLWEAQYGDFDNGAQIAIDHYIVASEQKWARYSSLVMLLPHGYEGNGPEHSSARLERFLQLCAGNNIQVAYPTTPAQIFHLLRRQAFRLIKKPLVVMSPKSLLRNPSCLSSLNDFTLGRFEEIIDDPKAITTACRLIICSGKIYYDLLAAREEIKDAAIIRIEQLYPFHEEKFKNIISKYKNLKRCVYVQEEPENMGAWEFIRSILLKNIPPGIPLGVIARPRSAATATGSHKKHKQELAEILRQVKNEN